MVSKHGALQRQLASYDKLRSQLVLNDGPQLEKDSRALVVGLHDPKFSPTSVLLLCSVV